MLRRRKAPKAKKSMVEALMRDMQGSAAEKLSSSGSEAVLLDMSRLSSRLERRMQGDMAALVGKLLNVRPVISCVRVRALVADSGDASPSRFGRLLVGGSWTPPKRSCDRRRARFGACRAT
jgi:hypothetical protein